MRKKPKTGLIIGLANHFGMGACLGTALALGLVRFNVGEIGVMIQSTIDPGATLVAFIGTLLLEFGVGATLTGYVLMEIDKNV